MTDFHSFDGRSGSRVDVAAVDEQGPGGDGIDNHVMVDALAARVRDLLMHNRMAKIVVRRETKYVKIVIGLRDCDYMLHVHGTIETWRATIPYLQIQSTR